MKNIISIFRQYLRELESKQVNHKQTKASKYHDILFIEKIVDHMKLKPAGEKEKELLQYGLFFDGENLFYDETIETIDNTMLNHALLNHILHFVFGAHVYISFKSRSLKSYLDNNALVFAHFNISGVKPRYGTSGRKNCYKYHIEEKGFGLIFEPHPKTANYFYEEYEAGNIKLHNYFTITKTKKLEYSPCLSYVAKIKFPHFNASQGFHILEYGFNISNGPVDVFLIEKNGKYERISPASKLAREIKDSKAVMEELSGELEYIED